MTVAELRKILESHDDDAKVVLRERIQPGDDFADYELENTGCPGGPLVLFVDRDS